MADKSPVLLFAFADRQDDHLPLLKEEERRARQHFRDLDDRAILKFQSLGSCSLDDLYRAFNRYHNRISIFHYAGHSDSGGLQLEDTSTRAANLATLISMQDDLPLVVLNGCANRAQAKLLLEAGAKVIIGTSCPIRDDQAVLFADQFYDGLVKGRNIRQAFDTALAYVSDKKGEVAYEAVRGQGLDAQANDIPWALYYREEDVLQWTLPAQPAGLPGTDENAFREDISVPHRRVNQSLITQVAEGLSHYDRDLKNMLLQYQQTKNPALFLDLKDEVLDRFPSVISSHIAALFNPKALPLSRQRLLELNYAYLALGRYLSGIALSNLWDSALDDAFEPLPDFRIREEYHRDLTRLLELNERSAPNFDHLWLLSTVHRILADNEIEPFMSELAVLHLRLATDKACYGAYRFLEQELRQPMAGGRIHRDDISALCLNAERQLAKLLAECAFLSTYELATVREIRVHKGKREAVAAFLHENAVLRGASEKHASIYPLPREAYTENQSIIVSKSLFGGESTLNLSPFIIDVNAYSVNANNLPDIHFWFGTDERGQLRYQRAAQMGDLFTVEREAGEDDLAEPPVSDFSVQYEGMDLLYHLFDDFKTDLKLQ